MVPGLERLIEKRRAEFRQPENINYYSEDDYRIAERKYVKFRLNGWGSQPFAVNPENRTGDPVGDSIF